MINTIYNIPISTDLLCNYFRRLVNLFFKILPMREKEEASLKTYMQSLQIEMLGCSDLINSIQNDPDFLTLLSILQYLIEYFDKVSVFTVKQEVFKAIGICNKLQSKYFMKTQEERKGSD